MGARNPNIYPAGSCKLSKCEEKDTKLVLKVVNYSSFKLTISKLVNAQHRAIASKKRNKRGDERKGGKGLTACSSKNLLLGKLLYL